MLELNLLPETLRKAPLSPIEQFHRTPLMWILATAMVLIVLTLAGPLILRQHAVNELNARIQELEPKREKITKIQQLTEALHNKENQFLDVDQGQKWSQQLNTISNLTPDGMWFQELVYDPLKGLILQGMAIWTGSEQSPGVDAFVHALRNDPVFSLLFKDVQIESLKRTMDGDIELVEFSIAAGMKEMENF